jgi:hypothetical protein
MSLTSFLLLSRLKMKWYSTPPIWLVFYCTDVIVVIIIPKWTYDNISLCKVPFDKLYTAETFMELSLYSSAVYVATSTVHHKITLHIIDCRYCTTFEVLTVVLLNIQVFWDVKRIFNSHPLPWTEVPKMMQSILISVLSLNRAEQILLISLP